MKLTIVLAFDPTEPGPPLWLEQLEEQLFDNLTPSQMASLIGAAADDLAGRVLQSEEEE